MSIDVEVTCPLGHTCEKLEDGKIKRCAWYVALAGKDPQSEDYIDEWRCSMAWQPILMIENAQTNRGQTQALESFRNEVVAHNNNLALAQERQKQNRLTEKVIDLEETEQ